MYINYLLFYYINNFNVLILILILWKYFNVLLLTYIYIFMINMLI